MRTLPPPDLTPQDIERFKSIIQEQPNGCWERVYRRKPTSYAAFLIGKSQYRASAISFLIFNGRYPTKLLCHTCDNPACVRPDHLFEGTNKDNSQDMLQKGRGGHHKFERMKGPRIPQKATPIPSGIHLFEAELAKLPKRRRRGW